MTGLIVSMRTHQLIIEDPLISTTTLMKSVKTVILKKVLGVDQIVQKRIII
jgi:hypothetical protein